MNRLFIKDEPVTRDFQFELYESFDLFGVAIKISLSLNADEAFDNIPVRGDRVSLVLDGDEDSAVILEFVVFKLMAHIMGWEIWAVPMSTMKLWTSHYYSVEGSSGELLLKIADMVGLVPVVEGSLDRVWVCPGRNGAQMLRYVKETTLISKSPAMIAVNRDGELICRSIRELCRQEPVDTWVLGRSLINVVLDSEFGKSYVIGGVTRKSVYRNRAGDLKEVELKDEDLGLGSFSEVGQEIVLEENLGEEQPYELDRKRIEKVRSAFYRNVFRAIMPAPVVSQLKLGSVVEVMINREGGDYVEALAGKFLLVGLVIFGGTLSSRALVKLARNGRY